MKKEKPVYTKATDDNTQFKSFFRKYIIAGKKMNKSQYENFLQKSTENIILSGFKDLDNLEQLLEINGYCDKDFMFSILLKLSETYEDQKQKEGDNLRDTHSPVNATNIVEICSKQEIIGIAMKHYASMYRYSLKHPFEATPLIESDDENKQG